MDNNKNNSVYNVLQALHEDAKNDYMHIGKGILKSIIRPIKPADFEHAYLPISKEQGEALFQLIIENEAKNVVEFGTSFGISTIYLANAVKQTGGKVITTELIESKAKKAMENFSAAGLSEFIDLRVGDAMQTLKSLTSPIDFLFLDGWKDLYLPLFQMLEPHFHKGTIIYADNMDMAGTQYYGAYVLSQKHMYESQMLEGGKAMLSACAA